MRLAYNFNKNDYNANRTDSYEKRQIDANTLYNNKRHSGSFNIDYSKENANNSSLIAGSHSTLIMDDINNAIGENPLFKHYNYNQYVYVGYGGSLKHLHYNASIEWKVYGQRQVTPTITIFVQGAIQVLHGSQQTQLRPLKLSTFKYSSKCCISEPLQYINRLFVCKHRQPESKATNDT